MADRDDPVDPDRESEPGRGSRSDSADDVIRRIADGADPSAEAFRFSNSFTDDWSARASAAVRRWFTRPR